MESPGIHSSIYGQLIFDKGANTQWRKGSPLNKWSCENWTTICKTMKLDPYFIPLRKINLKRIKELIIRHDSINSPRRKHREESSLTLVLAMIFFTHDTKISSNKSKLLFAKVRLHWTKKFLHSKTIKKWKGN